MIRFLANLKLRRKLLIAMAQLALMVVVAGLYASIQSKRIDTHYTHLLDQDLRTVQDLARAKAQVALFGQLLYEETAELSLDKCASSITRWTRPTPIIEHWSPKR